MKSLFIIIGLCAAFLAVSAQMPAAFKTGFAVATDQRQCTVAEKANNSAPALKRAKTGRLPRWHRLIPGMFR